MTDRLPRVRIEFYGLARLRAGRTEFQVAAATLGEALAAADAACPDLRALRDGRPSPEYLVSLGGLRFSADATALLSGGDVVIVVGADAGG